MSETNPIWVPSAERVASATITAFTRRAEARWSRNFPDYAALHRWSIEHPEEFWVSVWDECGVIGERGEVVLVDGHKMPGAQWFPQARLNFAENLLRRRDAREAMVFWGEDRAKQRWSWEELYLEVARVARALAEAGVTRGDRVAAYMPNMPHTIIAMLATASLGAIFTSASPDFGVQGVLDRFGQTEPNSEVGS